MTGSHYDEFKELKVLASTQPHMMARIREIIWGHNFYGEMDKKSFLGAVPRYQASSVLNTAENVYGNVLILLQK